MQAREGVGDAAVAVFHVYNYEIVAGIASDFGEDWREAAEEEAIQSVTFV